MSAGAKKSASELAVVDSWPAGARSESGQSNPAKLSSRCSTSSSDVVSSSDDSGSPENCDFASLLCVLSDTFKVVSVCFSFCFSLVLLKCDVVVDVLLVGILVTCVFNGKVVKLPGGSLFDFFRVIVCILEVCDVVSLIFSSEISSFSSLVVVGSLF